MSGQQSKPAHGESGREPNGYVGAQHSEFVTVMIAEQLFGIPVSMIQDVFQPQSMTRIPLAPPEIEGVLNLRGRIVTAIDVRTRLGLPKRSNADQCMAIGIEKDNESYGLIIDQVGEVLNLNTAEIDLNPPNLDARWREVAKGVCRLENKLMVILDVEKVLEFDRSPLAA